MIILHNARYVVTCNAEDMVLEFASLVIEGTEIIELGPAQVIKEKYTFAQVIDFTDQLLMPGLVNLHTHLPMTLLRGVAENVDLQGFLELVWAEEARIMDSQGTYLGARLGALESLLGGTTTALDMYLHPAANHRGAVEVGLRHVTGPVFFSFPGPDNLTWDARMLLAREWPETLREIGGPYVPLTLTPHAPLTVNPANLKEIAELAVEQGAIITVHASENISENEDTVAAHGDRPTHLLDTTGILDLKPVLAHGVHLDESERHLIASKGACVAHCPGSNLKLASGAADFVQYREDGITVGLGTDGSSSSNDLDMFAVMRLTANLARLVRNDPAAIASVAVVRAATIEGARALGMADRIGSLEVGKEADVISVSLREPHLVPVRDPFTTIVFSAGRADIRHVFVAGEQVVENRQPTKVDTEEIMVSALEHLGSGPCLNE
ncbi:MAG: amidohydrolase [Candidatus Nanopelagicales bacterium]|jgi:5-methylthioadenosine/S-adenosylhomocysteine deaminase|nr:amidohydrolase [Actinomycetes bacterium]